MNRNYVIDKNSHSARSLRGMCSRVAWLVVVLVFAQASASFAAATTPSSGTVSPSQPNLTFTGGPFTAPNPSTPLGTTPPVCTDQTCGVFALTINIPSTDANLYDIKVSVGWVNSGTTAQGNTASDFDLYIYQPDATGTRIAQSTGDSSQNPEVAGWRAASGNYTIYVVPFDPSPSVTFTGTVTLSPVPTATPTPTGTPQLITQKPVDVGTAGNEPIILAGNDGTLYISALQHIYRSGDSGATWQQLAGPLFAGQVNLNSDSSLAMDPGGRLYMTFDWPYAGSTAVCTSDDHGDNWTCNPVVVPGGTDRMWITAPSNSGAFEVTNEGLYETAFLKSIDRGLTWAPTQLGSGVLEPQTGPLMQKPGGSDILQPLKAGNLSFYVYSSGINTAVTSSLRATDLPGPLALPSASFGTDGTLYTVTETPNPVGGAQVVVARSSDEGKTWTDLPPIPGTTKGTAAFTWISAGSKGHVGVIYYYTTDNGAPGAFTTAVWSAVWAETYNADTANPTWTVSTVDPSIRTGAICVAASCSGDDRFSGDFITSMMDASDNAHLTWMKKTDAGATIRYVQIPVKDMCSSPSIEDDDPTIAYTNGWHFINDANASAGHFRVDPGQENGHSASLTFTVPTGKTGAITYFYARSPKGGTATVYVDNNAVGTVSYRGGADQNTTRDPAFGFSSKFGSIPSGNHIFRIVPNGDGVSFVDGFCIKNAATGTQTPAAGPGGTMNNTSSLTIGQGLSKLLPLPTSTKALAIMAETDNGAPFRLTLIDPLGSTVKTVDMSSGIGVITVPAPKIGTYVLKGTNIGGTSVTVRTSVTPWVSR